MLFLFVVVILVVIAQGLRLRPTARYWPPKPTRQYFKYRLKQDPLQKVCLVSFVCVFIYLSIDSLLCCPFIYFNLSSDPLILFSVTSLYVCMHVSILDLWCSSEASEYSIICFQAGIKGWRWWYKYREIHSSNDNDTQKHHIHSDPS